jgi:hypothetical protein
VLESLPQLAAVAMRASDAAISALNGLMYEDLKEMRMERVKRGRPNVIREQRRERGT